jgi:hypothetical protein
MKKQQPKYVREFKQKIAREVAQNIRKRRREELAMVLTKDKVKTYGDIIAIFDGLSKKAKDSAVLCRIYTLACFEKTPTEIMKIMEPKKMDDLEKQMGFIQ